MPGSVAHTITKVCVGPCGEEKALAAFGRNKRRDDGHETKCKECSRASANERARRYRERHPARVKASAKRHYDTHREQILAKQAADPETNRAKQRRYRERHPDRIKSGWAAWAAKNPERVAAWRVENAEVIYAGIRAWQKANPEKVAEYAARRRARKHGAQGTHTAEEWQEVLDMFGRVCLCCLRSEEDVQLTRDHVVPLAKGGRDDVSNLQPLCRPCNSRKGLDETDYRMGVV